jgi:type IV pilus assembly protein PilV
MFMRMRRQNLANSGFTLVEILVSVLVLAIGLLGMSALQVTGLRSSHSAYLRTHATLLAHDISERIRANPLGLQNGRYNQGNAAEHVDCLDTIGCNATDLAEHDLFEWNSALAAQLPSGGGIVCLDGTPNDGTATAPACDGAGLSYAIKIWWDDNRSLQQAMTTTVC